ncbi:hypothetical protein, partial [Mycoplasmopsis bovis]|uniref:hypothetical protein n=1 Tax=Mycoplasmopsis bovis TaxID=28903 RepID=UPI003D2B6048
AIIGCDSTGFGASLGGSIVASPTTERRKININGVEVYAIVEVTPDRKVTEYDIKKGIANRDPYQSTIVNKLVSVKALFTVLFLNWSVTSTDTN